MIKIGITDTESNYENYSRWIKNNNATIQIIKLHWKKYPLNELWRTIKECNGIVLTGGIDVHPKFYDNFNLDFNNKYRFNEERDMFEIRVFETAMSYNLPVLGICRGHQLINIALGGNLIQDLEENGYKNHRKHNNRDRIHGINVLKNTLLANITQVVNDKINSSHHQGIDVISDELIVSAYSPDFVIEAAEWKDKSDKPWLLLVQWHPERMKPDSPFSKNIRERFINESKLMTEIK